MVTNPQNCYKCHSYLMFKDGGLCLACEKLDSDIAEVRHKDFVRCPYCKNQMSISNDELFELYDEDDHEVTCNECGKEFTIITSVSYSFESPALILESQQEGSEA